MSSNSNSKVDVLVIGAGPAGLMAGNALARAGVNVRVVDKRPKKVAAGQADGIQPRTIESYGLAERLLREGNQMHLAAFYNPSPSGGIAVHGRAPDVTATNARYPFEVTLHQGAIEAIFLDSMREHGGLEIERPIQPSANKLDESPEVLASLESYPVQVTLKHFTDDGQEEREEVVQAKYVLGADGAHSWVRRTLGFTMDGEQTDYVWGVVDMIPTTDFPDIRNKTAIHSKNGSCMIIPREGDIVRLYIQLSDEDAKEVLDAKGRIDKMRWTPQRLMAIAKRNLQPYTIEFPEDVEWWTLYIIGQRVASNFSLKERVFIAGDACHTHSPKAGQGMNASMNDSHNLMWKLVHVLRGWADPSILKTYELERRKYAQDLIDFDRKFAALFSGKPRSEENQEGVTHDQFLAAFQTFGGFTSGIGIQYSPSLLTVPSSSISSSTTATSSSTLATHLDVGTRFPPQVVLNTANGRPHEIQDSLPSDGRWKLIVFTGNLGEEEGARRRVQEFAEGDNEAIWKKEKREWDEVFEIVSVMAGKKEVVDYTDVPAVLRSHWTKVFVDDEDVQHVKGGKAYATYGISPERGAVVVVRPDGYIGLVAPLGGEGVSALETYFAGFMKPA
ncbi:uncharacterized protein FOMMEDRAFT_92013 [Fomitiporia mediterranea MF3/22]|uniref:uncharacterized protein n=1 Tax=Fomitiporia mediterranea (strain MF3/22) TaxID=694068 RepID=UPI0004409374|nr:uncharacterized protein FOMMEDRAFT_92013 [Fomitiporia mediterranea MF3/22]EJC99951.1 hypothetical protein FOMMEDRAFT_92013 [Fomitiporia mediterranea MF3/22]